MNRDNSDPDPEIDPDISTDYLNRLGSGTKPKSTGCVIQLSHQVLRNV